MTRNETLTGKETMNNQRQAGELCDAFENFYEALKAVTIPHERGVIVDGMPHAIAMNQAIGRINSIIGYSCVKANWSADDVITFDQIHHLQQAKIVFERCRDQTVGDVYRQLGGLFIECYLIRTEADRTDADHATYLQL